MEKPTEPTLSAVAEGIVRDQEFLCVGASDPVADYCSTFLPGAPSPPLCEPCQKLANAIAAALEAQASRYTDAQARIEALERALNHEAYCADKAKQERSKAEAERDAARVALALTLEAEVIVRVERDTLTTQVNALQAEVGRLTAHQATPCEACDAGYRLAHTGVHYDDAHGGATWGVCRKRTASLGTP